MFNMFYIFVFKLLQICLYYVLLVFMEINYYKLWGVNYEWVRGQGVSMNEKKMRNDA